LNEIDIEPTFYNKTGINNGTFVLLINDAGELVQKAIIVAASISMVKVIATRLS